MWLRNWSMCVALVVWALLSPALAQQPIRWQYSLESAKQLAGQTNRLVVVHFWADWCPPCKRMEQDVFSRPDVAAALEADYVAVKVHRDQFPTTAKEFGVTSIPADIIITPQGQVLERFEGYADANQYVGRMNRVAANYRMQNGRMFAQIPGQPATRPATPGPGMPSYGAPGYQPSSGPQALADNRAMDSLARPPQAATIAANPPYAGRPPMDFGGPRPEMGTGPQMGLNGPGLAAGPSGPSPMGIGVGAYGMPPAVQPDPTRSSYAQGPAVMQEPTLPPQDRPYAGPVVQPSMASPTLTSPPTQSVQPWQATPPNTSQMGGAPTSEAPASRGVELPAGNPPLALDGYCPVQLTEKERWVRGNPKWGVRHEGRTYLFAGPEEQSRFYADPDHFAPVLNGDDVVLMLDQGQRVPGRREHGGWFQNRVYLFASEASFQKFFSDPHRYASAVAQTKASVASRSGMELPSVTAPQAAPWMGPNPVGANTLPYYR